MMGEGWSRRGRGAGTPKQEAGGVLHGQNLYDEGELKEVVASGTDVSAPHVAP